VQRRLHADFVARERAGVLELTARKDQAHHVGRSALLEQYERFDTRDRKRRVDVQSYRLCLVVL
jgi:hypothetical protein